MAEIARDAAPLTVEAMAEHLADGCKPASAHRIGSEHEKFVFRTADNGVVPYGPDAQGRGGIEALLKAHERYGWTGLYEDSDNGPTLIAMEREGGNISLEPGGQFELSGAPLEDVHQVCAEIGQHLTETKAIAGELGIGFLTLGHAPIWRRDQIPVMPKGRYAIMRAYMPKVGGLGLDMMFRTCTVQANLDFESEADMVAKFRLSLALQPIATALFANSPFVDGAPTGYLSSRARVWTDTDPDRTGMLGFVFQDGFGFETYARYALDVPMYFVRRNGRYIDASGQSFRAFMAGELPALPGERPTIKDWSDHLTTLFPEVRLKTYLEMRGADTGPPDRLCALAALWIGLFYDKAAQAAAWDLVKGWTIEDHDRLRADAARVGLKAVVAGRTAQAVAQDVLAIAREGLKRRARLSGGFLDETGYLGPLDEIAASGITPAERWLELYNGAWAGDLTRIYEAAAY